MDREPLSRLHVIIAHCPSSKDHELIKLSHPNGFKLRNSDDLHVKMLLPIAEIMGKYQG